MAESDPPRSWLSRRGFLRTGAWCAGGALLAALPTGLAAPPLAPRAAQAGCGESAQEVLNALATVEALATTFYYQSIQGHFFSKARRPASTSSSCASSRSTAATPASSGSGSSRWLPRARRRSAAATTLDKPALPL